MTSPPKSPRRHVPPPAHLSEFLQYVDGSTPKKGQSSGLQTPGDENQPPALVNTGGTTENGSPVSRKGNSNLSISSSNMNYSLSVSDSLQSSPSALDLETLITDNDVKETLDVYTQLLRASQNYRAALDQVCSAASDFGSALEACARLKGSGSASDGLMNCSGVQYLIANKQQLLERVLASDFEVPVSEEISHFQQLRLQADLAFQQESREKVHALKTSEHINRKLAKKKYRNITAYRTNLQDLTQQLDEIDRLKHDYYVESFDHVQAASTAILKSTKSIVGLETAISDSVAQKGDVGSGLDLGNVTITDADVSGGSVPIDGETTPKMPKEEPGSTEAASDSANTEPAPNTTESVPTTDSSPTTDSAPTTNSASTTSNPPLPAQSATNDTQKSSPTGSDKTLTPKDDGQPAAAISMEDRDDTYYTPPVIKADSADNTVASTSNILDELDSTPEKVRTHDENDPFSLPSTVC